MLALMCVYVGSDGATRSGLVCVLLYVLEQLRVDLEVDVYTAAKQLIPFRKQILGSCVSCQSHIIIIEKSG